MSNVVQMIRPQPAAQPASIEPRTLGDGVTIAIDRINGKTFVRIRQGRDVIAVNAATWAQIRAAVAADLNAKGR